jgi:hypothetical protein
MYGVDISAVYFLMGLRHQPYQRVEGLNEGRLQGLNEGLNRGDLRTSRTSVLLLGTQRFGTPPAEVVSKIEAISDLAVLQKLLLRTLDVTSWADLLA